MIEGPTLAPQPSVVKPTNLQPAIDTTHGSRCGQYVAMSRHDAEAYSAD